MLVRLENQMYNALNGYNFKETEERGENHKDPPPKWSSQEDTMTGGVAANMSLNRIVV